MTHFSDILGAETVRDIGELALGILGQTWQQSFTTKDMWILSVALCATLMVVTVQLYMFKVSIGKGWGWGSLLGMIVFDMLVFVGLVVGQIKLTYWMLDLKAPRSVMIERISPEIVLVNWKTYDPEYSMVLWGYDPERMYEVELGIGSHKKDRTHEVVIESEKGSEVYLMILVGEEMYGTNAVRGGEPYGVEGEK